MHEINALFRDFNDLLKEQEESIDLIDDNVNNAVENVEIGVEEIKSARSKTSQGALQQLTKSGPLGMLSKLLF